MSKIQAKAGAPQAYLDEVVLPFVGDECLDWPFSKNSDGYPNISDKAGSSRLVSRVICERQHGEPPTNKHQAAHSCGNNGCVNPGHLRWATKVENEADKRGHGTHIRGAKHSFAKLTEAQAREVLSLTGVVRQAELARRYGVSPSAIADVQKGRSWRWLSEVRSAA